MTRHSLGADYFEGIFQNDQDPWGLDSSAYERAKFDATIAALDGRQYRSALEIGCANGALTERLVPLCDRLFAIDISSTAVANAHRRLASVSTVRIRRMHFPQDQPGTGFDLILLSEIAYYWSDNDLVTAGRFIDRALEKGGDVLLVHFTGQTDYPQTADGAVEKLQAAIGRELTIGFHHRSDRYRIDLWRAR